MKHQNNISYTPNYITQLGENEVFVFGSNTRGNHHSGAAALAKRWGAIQGQGEGLQGKTYAIPTMFPTALEIQPYVNRFIDFALQHPEKTFLVTKIGCGIAGFTEEEIAPLFQRVVSQNILNITLPEKFVAILCMG